MVESPAQSLELIRDAGKRKTNGQKAAEIIVLNAGAAFMLPTWPAL